MELALIEGGAVARAVTAREIISRLAIGGRTNGDRERKIETLNLEAKRNTKVEREKPWWIERERARHSKFSGRFPLSVF